MKANKGNDLLNYKGIMDDLNKNIKNSTNESYIKGLEMAKIIVRSHRITDDNSLEARIKRYAFNNEVSLDYASKILLEKILSETPLENLYRELFGC